tara:strand:- start:534 stop:2021 length:1488 start_codon:yes stop_codon:yes gene_type:complete
MSGPILPPLTVTEVDGSPEGRPITTIKVSNGDLTVSGNIATIDTTGAATSPGGADREIQWNDGGAFQGGDSGATCTITTSAYIGGSVVGGGFWGISSNDAANAGVQIAGVQTDGSTGANLYVENGDTRQGIMLQALGTGGGGADGPVYIGRGLITTSGASTPLTLTAADEGVRTSITIETGVNGGITMKSIGTGSYNFQQQSTDGDTVVNVTANGTGTPKVKLENGSMAVQTICEANKKFTIEGGNGGETFVFDVSSATGGLTFPDGTELVSAEGTAILSTGEAGGTKFLREDGDGTCSWQAAGGGGGNEFNAVLNPAGTYYTAYGVNIGGMAPYGGCDQTTATLGFPQVRYWPFISPNTGNLASMTVKVTVASADGVTQVAVYDDAAGIPTDLIGYADFDTTSAASITQASFSATIALTKGTQYWYAETHTTANLPYMTRMENGGSAAIGINADSFTDEASGLRAMGIQTLQDPADMTDVIPATLDRLGVIFKW